MQYLQKYGLASYHYLKRCAFDPEPEPRSGKKYKMICSGMWLQAAATHLCACILPHVTLMETVVQEDGKVRVNGKKILMLESGRYPLAMGHLLALEHIRWHLA